MAKQRFHQTENVLVETAISASENAVLTRRRSHSYVADSNCDCSTLRAAFGWKESA